MKRTETKTPESTPAEPISFQKDFVEERKRNLDLKAQLEAKNEEIASLKRKLSYKREKEPPNEPVQKRVDYDQHGEEQQQESSSSQIATSHRHYPSQRFCPTCVDDQRALNPEFKDESWCADCGEPMGAVSELYDPVRNPKGRTKRCPRCGGKKARVKQIAK
jgi:rubredoxin